ncbi:hypothetical protein THAOC_20375, partial [Thalassiosira oceanica]
GTERREGGAGRSRSRSGGGRRRSPPPPPCLRRTGPLALRARSADVRVGPGEGGTSAPSPAPSLSPGEEGIACRGREGALDDAVSRASPKDERPCPPEAKTIRGTGRRRTAERARRASGAVPRRDLRRRCREEDVPTSTSRITSRTGAGRGPVRRRQEDGGRTTYRSPGPAAAQSPGGAVRRGHQSKARRASGGEGRTRDLAPATAKRVRSTSGAVRRRQEARGEEDDDGTNEHQSNHVTSKGTPWALRGPSGAALGGRP